MTLWNFAYSSQDVTPKCNPKHIQKGNETHLMMESDQRNFLISLTCHAAMKVGGIQHQHFQIALIQFQTSVNLQTSALCEARIHTTTIWSC
jgi:hypothetical protein